MVEGTGSVHQETQGRTDTFFHLTREFEGRDGKKYSLYYYEFPQGETHSFQASEIGEKVESLKTMSRAVFTNYSETGFENLFKKLDSAKSLDIVTAEDGTVVGFHVYKIGEVESVQEGTGKPVKVIYVDHAGTHPDYENKGISTRSREEVYEIVQPDVICGSSANPAIYNLNRRIADERGMAFYPKDASTPKSVYDFGNRIHEKFSLTGATLETDLRRTYPSGPVSKGKGPHPLHEVLPLGDSQHIFYMLLKPEVNYRILAAN